jgi:hypothetical protein
LGHDNKNGGVDERHQEDVSHDSNIILGYIAVSHMVTNEIENISDNNVDESNPKSKNFCLVLLDISNRSPVLAVLLTIREKDIISGISIHFV